MIPNNGPKDENMNLGHFGQLALQVTLAAKEATAFILGVRYRTKTVFANFQPLGVQKNLFTKGLFENSAIFITLAEAFAL